MILDIFSRHVVRWLPAKRERAELAEQLIADCALRPGCREHRATPCTTPWSLTTRERCRTITASRVPRSSVDMLNSACVCFSLDAQALARTLD